MSHPQLADVPPRLRHQLLYYDIGVLHYLEHVGYPTDIMGNQGHQISDPGIGT